MLRTTPWTAMLGIALLTSCGSSSPTGGETQSVESVTLSTAQATIMVGKTHQLTTTARDADGHVLTGKQVVWTSSEESVATVNGAGIVSGIAVGSSEIMATIDGKSATAQISVQLVPVASVTVTPTTLTLLPGEKKTLTATAKDAQGNVLTGRLMTWSSTTPTIAVVDNATGEVTGVAGGTASILAASEGRTATVQVTVTAPAGPPVHTIEIPKGLDTLEAFDTQGIDAVVRDAQGQILAGRVITWSVSNPAIATIENNSVGVLTGLDRGTVIVTATSEGKIATATRVVVIKYRSITAGTMHACDLASGGIAWCWGLNGSEGRIGSAQLGATEMSSTAVRVPGNHRFRQLASFGRHTCGLTETGAAWCWGTNAWGSLGANLPASQSFTPVAVAGGHSFTSISAGSDHVCGIDAITSALWCWGKNDWRQLGTGNSTAAATPVPVNSANQFRAVGAGASSSCGVTLLGTAYCWGANQIGQAGDGGTINYGNVFVTLPQAVVGGHQFQSISLGSQYACALTLAGQAYCWGSNNGKLGSGGNDSSTPVAVAGGRTFTSISTGYGHACGITTAEEGWCWGGNGYGQLGNAVPGGSAIPVRAAGSTKLIEIAAAGISTGSAGHTCAISADRLTTYCWGRNDVGQLGNGGTATPDTFTPNPTIVVGQKPL
jgi:alpha-tubulin suppressor-like RCC1 family protein